MTNLRPLSFVISLGLGLATAVPAAAADGLAGPYLAGRHASRNFEYNTAADFFTRALVADPTNVGLLENAIISQVGRGSVEMALPPAEALGSLGQQSQFADLVILADLARKGEFEAAIADLDKGRSAGSLVDGLYRAWALVGMGQMSEATLAFDAVAETEGSRIFGLYHKALALASVGDFEGADRILSGEESGPVRATKRGIVAHAQVLSQLERNSDAIELIDAVFGDGPSPELADLRKRLEAGETLSFTLIPGPSAGIAEVFYTVASALFNETSDHFTLAYARMAEYIAPDDADTILLAAEVLEAQGQHDLATETYNRIAPDNPAFLAAELGRSDALIASGRVDAAVEVLTQLAKAHPDRVDIWSALGDTYRRQEQFADAAKAYDRAIAALSGDERGQWIVYYTRGIANEREKNWEQAETDFRKALELQPNQPSVLNYLGYSYLERKENYDEALKMIETAVAERPDDGAIVDSLGWALYRLGRYDEAVVQMELAVELMPVDPVVNDHLGDVYWAVGRQREAEFQWKRALSFEPDTEEEAARIRRKLEVGLDAVLKEEGAEPLAVTKNDG